MQIFLDTAEIDELRAWADTGLIDGVTTNPSLIAKSGRKIDEAIAEICTLILGPVSAEAVATAKDEMIAEGRKLAAIAPNVVIKLPLTPDGLRACRTLTEEGFKVNVTLCFSAAQALLAAKSGAAYISPFIGRLDDAGVDGMALIHDIRAIYDNFAFETEILAASIRTTAHLRDAAIAGADCSTIPTKILDAAYKHALTDSGLKAFLDDWEKTGQSILG